MQFPLLGNVFPISHTVRAMRNKSIPSILSATLLIAILMAPLASADSGDETITVNHVVLVDTPQYKEWSWNYSYQTEVNDLQMNVSYTAVILIKQIGDDEWGGLDWWWDDIESDGDQYDFTFSLQRGCYFINASLHESDDLNSDVENATVLAGADLDFVVGNGTCVDGVYSEEEEMITCLGCCGEWFEIRDEGGCPIVDCASCYDDNETGGLPGFGIILSITAALGAALIATRRE
jgi:PGF-CTERM protein